MRAPAQIVVALVTSLTACAEAAPAPSPPDPRIASVDEVLSPPWRVGSTWTLEVHGKALHDKYWAPYWGMAHYEVRTVDETRATLEVEFYPIMGKLGDLTCRSRLEFDLPWRLIAARLAEPGVERRSIVTDFSPNDPPRTGTSPCIPLAPRHPTLRPTNVTVPQSPQSIEVSAQGARFTLYDASFTRITWVRGHPWWALMEKVGTSRTAFAMRDGRRRDQAQVYRARLVAIDGGAIEALPWSIEKNWLRDNWPSGITESDLLPVDPSPFLPDAAVP